MVIHAKKSVLLVQRQHLRFWLSAAEGREAGQRGVKSDLEAFLLSFVFGLFVCFYFSRQGLSV